ncbi:MAG: thioredoxin-like domain-containing protein [Bacteroidales bacterium]|jgi:thiol-disulfide isomerase/thioredoxin|nr:thioredoxin-like domain-containing protein [Bacteroidales bacterium]
MIKASKKLHLIAITLIICNSLVFSQGYNIKLNAPDFAGQEVILAEYFANRMVPKDTAQISLIGEAEFSGDQAFDGGLYIMYFNAKYYFDFMIDRDQSFSLSVDSTDLIQNTQFEGSIDNTLYYQYKKYLGKQRKRQTKLLDDLAIAKTSSDSSKISGDIRNLNKEIEAHIKTMISDHNSTFFSIFLNAMQENHAPESILKGSQRQKDSIAYVFYKDHYFDEFNAGDIRLLHTPLYENKIKTYINKVVPQHPDSLIIAVDKLIIKSRADEAIFRYMLITMFNNFAESKMMGMDKVYFHIAETYYIPEATWSDDEFITKLKENLEKSKPTFIGNVAPNFELKGIPKEHFSMAAMDTAIKKDPYVGYLFNLSDISAKYTLLYFWEADCGHCKKSTPKLYEVFEKYKDQGVEVLAVHVINSIEGKEKWIDFINEYELLDWTNCWSPHNNDFRTDYNLLSFPQLFLLDEDKKIIAKGLAPEQVGEILDRLLKKE